MVEREDRFIGVSRVCPRCTRSAGMMYGPASTVYQYINQLCTECMSNEKSFEAALERYFEKKGIKP